MPEMNEASRSLDKLAEQLRPMLGLAPPPADNCGLEPIAVEAFSADTDGLLASIAISMKRIADALDKMETLPIAIEGAIWNGIRSAQRQ